MGPSIAIRSPVVIPSPHPLSRLSSRETISVCGSGRLNLKSATRDKVIGSYEKTSNFASSSSKRISTEDVLVQLSEKLKPCNFPAFRKSFRANDPRGKGRIPREAFSRVIWQHCGFVPMKQIDHLLKRLQLDNREGITFDEFLSRASETGLIRITNNQDSGTNWIKPVALPTQNVNPSRPASTPRRTSTPRSSRSQMIGDLELSGDGGSKCWNLLKVKAQRPDFDAKHVFPSACFGPGGYIIPPQLREAFRKLDIEFFDDDIAKIFRRLDGASPFAVPTKKLFELLSLDPETGKYSTKPKSRRGSAQSNGKATEQKDETDEIRLDSASNKFETKRPWTTQGRPQSRGNHGVASETMSRPKTSKGVTSIFSGNVLKLLMEKLDEGSSSFIRLLEARDKSQTGAISKPEFRVILSEHGLNVKPTNLQHFIMRNGLKRNDGLINYRLLLRRLQSRSNRSLLHKVMNNPDHYFHSQRQPPSAADGLSASMLESRLLEMFQKNFLLLLQTLKQYDRSSTGSIMLGDLRFALQERLDTLFSDDAWSGFVSSPYIHLIAPPSGSTNQAFINYNDFLSKFDVMLRPSSADNEDPWNQEVDDRDHLRDHKEKYLKGMSGDMNDYTLRHDPQPLNKLEDSMVRVFVTQFKQIKAEYDAIVREDLCRVDKEKFDYIMFRCGFILTASELSRLWLSLPITRPIESISFPALLQHVVRLHYAATMPSKFNRQTGDGTILSYIMDKMRSQVVSKWNVLKEKLRFQDPMGTSRIPMEDMISLLYDIRPNVLDVELYHMVYMLESRIPLKTNYFKFMEYYSKNRGLKRSRGSTASSRSSSQPQLSDTTSVIAVRPKPNPEVVPQHGYVYQRKSASPFVSLRNAPEKPPFKRVTKHEPNFRGARSYTRRYDETSVPKKFTQDQFIAHLGRDEAKKLYRLSPVDLVRHPVSVSSSSLPPSTAPGASQIDYRRVPSLRRALRAVDHNDVGRLPVDEFQRVMKKYGVEFRNQDELYKLLSKYDRKMGHVISYERYLKNIRQKV